MANPDHLWLGLGFNPDSTEPVNFIETAFHYLSPFSAHEVELDGIVYKTAEHAYHALRMVPEVREMVMETTGPMAAWRKAQELKAAGKLDETCDKLALMEKIFRGKLAQHPDIREVLLLTGDRELLKVHDTDYYWGTGADGTGENQMGKLWMKLRAELK